MCVSRIRFNSISINSFHKEKQISFIFILLGVSVNYLFTKKYILKVMKRMIFCAVVLSNKENICSFELVKAQKIILSITQVKNHELIFNYGQPKSPKGKIAVLFSYHFHYILCLEKMKSIY